MRTVLVVDEDSGTRSDLQDKLREDAYHVMTAADWAEAARILDAEPVDILLLDGGVEQGPEGSLIERAQHGVRDVTTIVMLANATAREAKAALDRGADEVLDKPFSDDELFGTLESSVDSSAIRGNLSGVSLVDMLQMFHLGRRSLVLHIGGRDPARLYFDGGEVVHAVKGDRVGPSVVQDVLQRRSGAIRTTAFEDCERTIEESFSSLVLDALRKRDESVRDRTQDLVPALPEADDLELSDDDFAEVPAEPAAEERPPLRAVPGGEASAPPIRVPLELVTSLPEIDGLIDPEPPAAPVEVPAPPTASTAAAPPRPPTPTASRAPRAPDPVLPASRAEPLPPTALPTRPFDPICRALTAELPSAVATALIELDSGALVGLHNQTDFTPDFERFIALYTRSLFRGPEITHIETTMRRQRGVGSGTEHYLEEVVLSSRHTHHLAKVVRGGRYAIMIVTPRRTDVGAVWSALRTLLPGLESHLA